MKKILFVIVAIFMLTGCSEKPNEKAEEELFKNNEIAGEPVSEPVEVTMSVDTIFEEDGKVHFIGETNLPDYAEIMFTVSGPDYTAQTKETVVEGAFKTESFSKKGEALPGGEYNLSLSLSIPSTQDDKFVEIAGENYENLIGDLMEESELGKTMKYNTSFIVEEEVEKEKEEVAEKEKEYISSDKVKEIIQYYAIGEQDKLSNVEVVNGEIKATIEMAPNEMFPVEDLAVVSYSGLSDELLNRNDWEILTIEFVGVGTISMNRNEKESNEYGDYFPTLVIEEKLK